MTCPVCGSAAKITDLQDEGVEVDCAKCTPFRISKAFLKMMPGKVFNVAKAQRFIRDMPRGDGLPTLTQLDAEVLEVAA